MASRKRDKRIVLQVTQEERNIIEERQKYFDFSDMSSYIRKAAIDVNVINVNTDGLKELALQVSKVGNNINQIVKLCSQKQNVEQEDVDILMLQMSELIKFVNTRYEELEKLYRRSEVDK